MTGIYSRQHFVLIFHYFCSVATSSESFCLTFNKGKIGRQPFPVIFECVSLTLQLSLLLEEHILWQIFFLQHFKSFSKSNWICHLKQANLSYVSHLQLLGIKKKLNNKFFIQIHINRLHCSTTMLWCNYSWDREPIYPDRNWKCRHIHTRKYHNNSIVVHKNRFVWIWIVKLCKYCSTWYYGAFSCRFFLSLFPFLSLSLPIFSFLLHFYL